MLHQEFVDCVRTDDAQFGANKRAWDPRLLGAELNACKLAMSRFDR